MGAAKYKYNYNGRKYGTMQELADGNGVKQSTMQSVMSRQGVTYREYLDRVVGARVEYKGETYTSLTELATVKGLNVKNVRKKMAEGYTMEYSIKECKLERDYGRLMFRGKRYQSQLEAAADYGYTLDSVWGYIKNRKLGIKFLEGLEQLLTGNSGGYTHHQIEYDGKAYRNLKELIESRGYSLPTIYHAKSQTGKTVLEIIQEIDEGKRAEPIGGTYTLVYKGGTYKSKRHLIREKGLDAQYGTIVAQVNKLGISIQTYFDGVDSGEYKIPKKRESRQG